MNHSWKYILLFAFLFGLTPAFSQTSQQRSAKPKIERSAVQVNRSGGTFSPAWKSEIPVSNPDQPDKFIQAPWFQGASLDQDVVNLPYYVVEVPVETNERVSVSSSRSREVTEVATSDFGTTVRAANLPAGTNWYPAKNVVEGPRVIRKKQHFQLLHVYPIQVDASGSTLRKAENVSWSISRRIDPALANKTSSANKTSVTNSVLSSGNWYRIPVTEEGIYRLDYDFLNSAGINLNSIDPREIQIYGNGGRMLPQRCDEFRYDDLAENAIFVSGENDGSFNANDYVLFYGDSPHRWEWNERLDRFSHSYNLYSDTTWYYLTVGSAQGKRIQTLNSAGATTQTPNSVVRFDFHEDDLFNGIGTGRTWLGETFDFTTNRTYSFPLENLSGGSDVQIISRVATRSASNKSSFTLREGGNNLMTLSPFTVNPSIYGDFYYKADWDEATLSANAITDGSLDVDVSFTKANSSAVGWMDFIEVLWRSQVRMGGDAFWFALEPDPGEVYQLNIGNSSSNAFVWNVTDPVNVRTHSFSTSGSTVSFNVSTDSAQKLVSFFGNQTKTPALIKSLPNQDLHGLSQAEYLIITHPLFLNSANSLAQFHRDQFGRTVNVVNVEQVYHEFGSGQKNPTAIRDFIRMFYLRAQDPSEEPKYVLLFGDGSYDFKEREGNGKYNFIPTYQSRKSQRPTESYTSDDYYGFLDGSEGFWGENARAEGGIVDVLFDADGDTAVVTHYLDLAIGRIPANTVEEADLMVDKIINYSTNNSTFGPWRNRLLLIADHKDADGKIHLTQADSYTSKIKSRNACINVDKIYLDNYEQENTANGVRHPDAKEAMIQRLNEGSLIVNYTGHGGETGWSNSKILEIPDIQNLDNGYNLPAYITATCEFGRFDDHSRQSGAEKVLLQPDGGSIAMFTTVRVVYSGPNFVLNTNFYDYALSFDSALGRYPTMGEVFYQTKNDSWLNGINNRNFTLLGDPALTLNYPRLNAVITTINGSATQTGVVDSLPSLSLVTVEGEVRDEQGNYLPNFNGDLFATVFDKPAKFVTKRRPHTFYWQKNRVFNGEASVKDGKFSFQFVVPIDISYEAGLGKISLYMNDMDQDGGGCNTEIYVGGTGNIVDDRGPELEVFMNDEKFAEGGMVDPNATMIVDVFDENGINTVGTGIGHELTAVLNGNENDVIVLNDFYAASKDSYQEGRIEYPFQDLPLGEHKVRVKVWDVANNSAEGEATFLVVDDANMALGHILNYPNPFSTNTKFFVEHNKHGGLMDIQIRIYTVSGRLVKTLEDSFFAEGNLYCDLDWDGLDEYGDALGRGTYVYQVSLRDSETGEKVTKFEKLVVLR